MGLLDMSPLGWIVKVTDFSPKSLQNTLDTVKEVHQSVVEIPINVAEELGLLDENSEALKDKHRKILDHLYAGIGEPCHEVYRYIAKQATAVNELFDFSPPPVDSTVVRLDPNNSDRKSKARKTLSG